MQQDLAVGSPQVHPQTGPALAHPSSGSACPRRRRRALHSPSSRLSAPLASPPAALREKTCWACWACWTLLRAAGASMPGGLKPALLKGAAHVLLPSIETKTNTLGAQRVWIGSRQISLRQTSVDAGSTTELCGATGRTSLLGECERQRFGPRMDTMTCSIGLRMPPWGAANRGRVGSWAMHCPNPGQSAGSRGTAAPPPSPAPEAL